MINQMRLDECCISISDGDHLPPPKSDCGVPFITISNIDPVNNSIDFSDTMTVPKKYYDSLLGIRKALVGDILYSVVGSFGIPVLIKENKEFVFQRHIAILRPNSKIVRPAYLYYIMKSKSFYAQADSYAIGSAQRTISLSSLRRMKVSIPSTDVQDQVIAALTAYDNLIEVNNKRIKVLEQMAENLYKEWFVRFRFPGHESVPFENGLPKGWVTKPLNEWLSSFFNGGWGEDNYTSKTPIEAAVIRGTDIEDVKDSNYCGVPIRFHKDNDVTTKKLQENDIVLELSNGNINNIGRTLFVTKEILRHFDSVICASFCKTLRFTDKRTAFFIWKYIEYLQNSGLMFFYKNTGANGINNFNFKRFLRMPITIPNDHMYLDKLIQMHNEISIIREKNCCLIRQRDLLLPRLMSGKLEV